MPSLRYHKIAAVVVFALGSARPLYAEGESGAHDVECQALGLIAKQMVLERDSGKPLKTVIATIKRMTPPNAQQSMIQTARDIYTQPWAAKLTPDGAEMSYIAACATSYQ